MCKLLINIWTQKVIKNALMFDLLQVEDSSRDPLDPVHHPLRVWRALTPHHYVFVKI